MSKPCRVAAASRFANNRIRREGNIRCHRKDLFRRGNAPNDLAKERAPARPRSERARPTISQLDYRTHRKHVVAALNAMQEHDILVRVTVMQRPAAKGCGNQRAPRSRSATRRATRSLRRSGSKNKRCNVLFIWPTTQAGMISLWLFFGPRP